VAGIVHRYSTTIRNDAGASVIADSTTITGDGEENFNVSVPEASTVGVVLAVDVSALVSFFIESDKAATLKPNSTSSPAQTLTLTANRALYWNNLLTGTNPLTTDITTLFFTNTGVGAALVKGGFLLDL
jgi:hypothetical protein